MPQNMMGTASEGSMFMVFMALILSMDMPELAIRKPPTIDSSVIMSVLMKSPSRVASRYMAPCQQNSTGAVSIMPLP